jgi:phage baseplate assembly protein W
MPISIKFPFKETTAGGVFMSNVTSLEAIQTNLISLLTTKRRNRVMRSQLYSPLWDYIFELWDDISAAKLKGELIEKIGTFIPEIEVSQILFKFVEGDNLLEVKVVYKARDLGEIEDEVSVVIPVDPSGSSGADDHS